MEFEYVLQGILLIKEGKTDEELLDLIPLEYIKICKIVYKNINFLLDDLTKK